MHYRNGREAKAGDIAVNLETGISGILYGLNAQSTSCNGRLAQKASNDPYVTIGDCVHIEDVAATFATGGTAGPT